MLELTGFERRLSGARLVLTGEGRIDRQTLNGKVIAGILKRTSAQKVPVIAFCGALQDGYQGLFDRGLAGCFSILPAPTDLDGAIKNAAVYLEDAVFRVMKLLSAALPDGWV